MKNPTSTANTLLPSISGEDHLHRHRQDGKRRRTTKPPSAGKEMGDARPEGTRVAQELIRKSAQELERRIAAVQTIRETEKERLLTELRLLRSCLSKEHLQTKALDFFRENLPNLSVIRNEEDLEFELGWKVKEFQAFSDTDDRFMHMYPGIFSSLPRFSGFGFSSKPVENDFLQSARVHTSELVLDEASDALAMGFSDSFQTPGGVSQRLSVGITPKTRRLPKNGEVLLSVRGSPLGVYKEDNMDTIQESPAR